MTGLLDSVLAEKDEEMISREAQQTSHRFIVVPFLALVASVAMACQVAPFQMRLLSTAKATISGTDIFENNEAAAFVVEFASPSRGASVTLGPESVFVDVASERLSPKIMFHNERSLEGDHLQREELTELTNTVGISVTVDGKPIPTPRGLTAMPMVLEPGGGAKYWIDGSGKWQHVFLFPIAALAGEHLTIGNQVLSITGGR